MTQARIPLTFAQAMTRIAGRIGYEAAAVVADRSIRTVYEWARPSTDHSPPIAQAAALDAAYVAAGGDGSPFLEVYQHHLDLAVQGALACHRALVSDIAGFAAESGEAIAATLEVSQGSHCPRKIHRALGELEQTQSKTGAVIRRLTSFLTAGAGPSAGVTGGDR